MIQDHDLSHLCTKDDHEPCFSIELPRSDTFFNNNGAAGGNEVQTEMCSESVHGESLKNKKVKIKSHFDLGARSTSEFCDRPF